MEYEIIVHGHPRDVELEVNDKIKKGWRPLGGIAVSFRGYYESGPREGDSDMSYYQAMTRGE